MTNLSVTGVVEMENENTYAVYKHTSPSGNYYIGITKYGDNLNKRWRDGRHYKECHAFYRAIQKYGWNNIKHSIIINNLSKKEAEFFEKLFIKIYKKCERCYNICDGGLGVPGVFQSSEWKNKKRVMPRGEKSHMFGRHLSQETRQKIRETHTGPLSNRYGAKLTDQHKQILKDSKKKSILQFDKNNNFIKRWIVLQMR